MKKKRIGYQHEKMDDMLKAISDLCGVHVTALAEDIGCNPTFASYAMRGERRIPKRYRDPLLHRLRQCAGRLSRVSKRRDAILSAIDDCRISKTVLADKLQITRTCLSSRIHRDTTAPEKLAEIQGVLRSIGMDLSRALETMEKE